MPTASSLQSLRTAPLTPSSTNRDEGRSAGRKGSGRSGRGGRGEERRSGGGSGEWDEDFSNLAATVRSSSATGRPSSAAPSSRETRDRETRSRPNPSRPRTSTPSSSITSKVAALESTVAALQLSLAEARTLVLSTAEAQTSVPLDSALAEKLAVLRRDQEKNVKIIEELVKQRDGARAKARRLEKVRVNEVSGRSGGRTLGEGCSGGLSLLFVGRFPSFLRFVRSALGVFRCPCYNFLSGLKRRRFSSPPFSSPPFCSNSPVSRQCPLLDDVLFDVLTDC